MRTLSVTLWVQAFSWCSLRDQKLISSTRKAPLSVLEKPRVSVTTNSYFTRVSHTIATLLTVSQGLYHTQTLQPTSSSHLWWPFFYSVLVSSFLSLRANSFVWGKSQKGVIEYSFFFLTHVVVILLIHASFFYRVVRSLWLWK